MTYNINLNRIFKESLVEVV